MATVRPPPDGQPIAVQSDNGLIAPRPWINFFRLLSTLWESLKNVTSITTPNVTPAANATADGVPSVVSVTSATLSALTDPLVTSANATAAGAGYVQATATTWVTLMNELKGDVNAIVTNQNTDVTLSNELKTDVNQLVTDLNALVTQFDALVAQVNVINTQLTANIALTNELKASHNAQQAAIQQ